ncbi:MAG: hypothetical protein CMQ28_05515 [Gammaproteobacteria bacterium]|nr:hypothetical protein [Chloroflexota bacterium]MBS25082.1 hypothetical protein [Gammaproteobacteria bacterium]|tara:strand:- start:2812 stop:3096 length:285 start_codon:yes stop_codon:yes gene_type:complete
MDEESFEVPILGISLNPLDNLNSLEKYREKISIGDHIQFIDDSSNLVSKHAITIRATKLAVAPDGTVLRRAEYGEVLSRNEWIRWLELIHQSSN